MLWDFAHKNLRRHNIFNSTVATQEVASQRENDAKKANVQHFRISPNNDDVMVKKQGQTVWRFATFLVTGCSCHLMKPYLHGMSITSGNL